MVAEYRYTRIPDAWESRPHESAARGREGSTQGTGSTEATAYDLLKQRTVAKLMIQKHTANN
jgi:hypothetical protein